MELHDQIKTTRGMLPSKTACFGSCDEHDLSGGCIDFELFSPEEALSFSPDASVFGGNLALESIGLLLKSGGDIAEIKKDELRDIATLTGPLFGISSQESVAAWRCVIMMAHDVIDFQEFVNGNKTLPFAEKRVAKTVVENTGTDNEFTIYAVSFEIGSPGASEYEEFLPAFPWFRKFRSEDSFDYVFAQSENVEGDVLLSVFLISFSDEITTFDFAAVLGYLKHDERIENQVLEFFGKEAEFDEALQSTEFTYGIIATPESLRVREVAIGQGDVPHVQKIIHALISLHLQGIAIDVFCSDENDGFMVFKNYLSYLWYEFSIKLDRVKIGYCEQCGKGFSLSGHRGIPRRFCGEVCKTKAKNARTKKKRDDIRLCFKAGQPVEDIARAYYPDITTEEAVGKIVKNLRSWSNLKK
ncbi:MAG: hypothetical protein RRX88_06405 [Raoultibacter sp.]